MARRIFPHLILPASASNYATTDGDRALKKLGYINIFVGPNNSGKSRLLRQLASQTHWDYLPSEEWHSDCKSFVSQLQAEISEKISRARNIDDVDSIRQHSRKLSEVSSVSTAGFDSKQLDQLIELLIGVSEASELRFVKGIARDQLERHDIEALKQIGNTAKKRWAALKKEVPNPKPIAVYVPVLRGLRQLDMDGRDLYLHRTRGDYFESDASESNERPIVFTGLSFFSLLRDYLLGTLREREFIANYQAFLSKNFFEGRPVVLIPRLSEGTVYMKVGREKEQPIHQLGDGLQQLMILTLPLFTYADKELLYFLEEPEHALHPGAQRQLLRALGSVNGKRQTFITTHSNHLLDSAIEQAPVSVFRIKKRTSTDDFDEFVPDFVIESSSFGDVAAIEDLGVRTSSVFLANRTIWVEGATDWRYLAFFMSHTVDNQKLPLRGMDYEFVEYGGSNLAHWNFGDEELEEKLAATRLCGHMLVVADKDSDKEEKHSALKAVLGDRYVILPAREIENLLSPAQIRGALLNYGEEIENLSLPANQSSYRDKMLGRYIDQPYCATLRRARGSLLLSGGDRPGQPRMQISRELSNRRLTFSGG